MLRTEISCLLLRKQCITHALECGIVAADNIMLKGVWTRYWIYELITNFYNAAENHLIDTHGAGRLPVDVAQQAKSVKQIAR